MRARLGMEPVPVGAEDVELIRWLGEEVATQMVEELPEDQREAMRATCSRTGATPRSRATAADGGDRAQARQPRPAGAARPSGREPMSSDYIARLRGELLRAGREPSRAGGAAPAPSPAAAAGRPSRPSRWSSPPSS